MSLDMLKHPRIKEFFTAAREYAVYGVLLTAALLVVFGAITVIQNREQQSSLDKQLQATNDLINQVKALSEENKTLSQTAANYAYCNAAILAKYTQTNDPITVEDLDACKFTSYPGDDGGPTSFNDAGGLQSSDGPLVASNTPSTGSNTSNSSASGSSSGSNNGNGGGGTTNPPANTPPTQPPVVTPPQNNPPAQPPVLTLDTPLLGVTLNTPCVGVQKLLYIGCR